MPQPGLTDVGRALSLLLAPPRCCACSRLAGGELSERLCDRCRRLLAAGGSEGEPPPGVDELTALTPYAGPAVGLVAALKSGRPGAAETAAELLAERLAPPSLDGATLVPVPGTLLRRCLRGVDPAEQLASALSPRLALPLASPLRRRDHRRQRGRPRRLRLADPPRFRVVAPIPQRALLVDDVATTGATLTACARALRTAGTEGIAALVLARTPSSPAPFAEPARCPGRGCRG